MISDKDLPKIQQLEYLCSDLRRQQWREYARQVLAGEWAHADTSTLRALHLGLACLGDEICQQAAKRLLKAL